jgi:WhiB family redox-sensing transcriptional regulator
MTKLFHDSGPIRGCRPSTPKPVQPRTPIMRAPYKIDPGWQLRGACNGEDPELFFPIGNTGPARLQIEDAKDVCRRCDVVDRCLAWALAADEGAGVWGGMSEDERKAYKRRLSRQAGR